MTIVEFLEARIAEDEQVARAATAGPWEWEEDQPMDESFLYGLDDIPVVVAYGMHTQGFLECSDEDRTHIAAHDPDRVLAECAAKRAIIGLHHPDRQLENWYWSMRKCAECGGTWHKWLNNDVPTDIGPEQGCPTLRALAAVYSDHPDYQQEWAL